MIYGYARVSTTGQTLDAQLKELRSEGCANIYREKQSGARADRRELLKLLKAIEHGDPVGCCYLCSFPGHFGRFDLFDL